MTYKNKSVHKEKKTFLLDTLGIKPTQKQVLLLIDLMETHTCSYIEAYEKFLEYYSAKTKYDKTLIRFGKIRADEFSKNMRDRARSKNPVSVFSTNYWITKHNLSESQSQIKISEMQKLVNSKRGPYLSNQNASNLDYYIHRGCSADEAVIEREKHLNEKCFMRKVSSFDNVAYIEFKKRYKVSASTKMKRYGNTSSGGVVSKESLRFFVKLYKILRKNGVSKLDIFWGITGSKEFATHSNGSNFLYDFTIRSKRIMVEYNGIHWHPRLGTEWRNSFYSFEDGLLKDSRKIEAANKIGYAVLYVWSDDDHEQKIKQLVEIILND